MVTPPPINYNSNYSSQEKYFTTKRKSKQLSKAQQDSLDTALLKALRDVNETISKSCEYADEESLYFKSLIPVISLPRTERNPSWYYIGMNSKKNLK